MTEKNVFRQYDLKDRRTGELVPYVFEVCVSADGDYFVTQIQRFSKANYTLVDADGDEILSIGE